MRENLYRSRDQNNGLVSRLPERMEKRRARRMCVDGWRSWQHGLEPPQQKVIKSIPKPFPWLTGLDFHKQPKPFWTWVSTPKAWSWVQGIRGTCILVTCTSPTYPRPTHQTETAGLGSSPPRDSATSRCVWSATLGAFFSLISHRNMHVEPETSSQGHML